MLTRCPACQKVFRVAEDQLALREGRVRCGHCLNAFNALHHAVETGPGAEDGGDAATGQAQAPQPLPDGAPPPEVAVDAAARDTRQSSPEAESDAAPGVDSPAADLPAVFPGRGQAMDSGLPRDEGEAPAPPQESAAEPSGEAASAAAQPPLIEEDVPPPTPEDDAATPIKAAAALRAGLLTRSDPAEERGENYIRTASIPVPPPALATPRKANPRRTQAIAVGVLSIALLVQGVFLLRQSLSQAFPGLRGPLLALCQRVGCELPLPREAAEISIEASDLHPEPGGQGDFVLHATLKNRARFPQAYPHVELSLTDTTDKPLARRVFTPAEWAPGTAPEAAFAPDTTAVVTLPFSAAGVAAVGYRVYAFYP